MTYVRDDAEPIVVTGKFCRHFRLSLDSAIAMLPRMIIFRRCHAPIPTTLYGDAAHILQCTIILPFFYAGREAISHDTSLFDDNYLFYLYLTLPSPPPAADICIFIGKC